jgi:hypothetical protein
MKDAGSSELVRLPLQLRERSGKLTLKFGHLLAVGRLVFTDEGFASAAYSIEFRDHGLHYLPIKASVALFKCHSVGVGSGSCNAEGPTSQRCG